MSRTTFEIEVLIALKKLGKTNKWLAEQLQISPSYLSDILHGNRKANDKVELISKILKIGKVG
ncbi:helix-turn-helix domain-containing protein [Lactobacillus salivarius]|jgi:DNA-binding CsgD family transcriptional regulator|uniref:helix-turn-helix domain-containing protein n=1 Tax=Ligilactobacillus salivarius TaxID=1624 RepID=UPI00136E0A0B|nr:helix-turn-helix domain-containing protein [Ligilactobacillus salivarius]MYU49130.1 helix-turn-helix domain-containing protein [Ligilactobacillus salivarius]MYU95471.1 helix-turn-helix domain-containing protein [Ligilactobacillus salivarius]MYZ22320.1 helix-turn-helix domain-containing protein [Ligilactobacillus salivarius]WGT60801.1 helix-turn-helix domain-containing protein [Ligilactobacillus salivarius]